MEVVVKRSVLGLGIHSSFPQTFLPTLCSTPQRMAHYLYSIRGPATAQGAAGAEGSHAAADGSQSAAARPSTQSGAPADAAAAATVAAVAAGRYPPGPRTSDTGSTLSSYRRGINPLDLLDGMGSGGWADGSRAAGTSTLRSSAGESASATGGSAASEAATAPASLPGSLAGPGLQVPQTRQVGSACLCGCLASAQFGRSPSTRLVLHCIGLAAFDA